MNDNKILQQLNQSIKSANRIKIEYGITGQEVNEEDPTKLLTVSLNTTMDVDYKEKTATIATMTGSFAGTTTTTEVFENFTDSITQRDSNSETLSTTTLKISEEEYNKLFIKGGKLYPLEIEGLIPIESERNSEKCQVCIPSNKLIECIPGYIKSSYTIYHKCENVYEVTMIMNQMDLKYNVELMQYCFTCIEIVS